jgi:hypothetical protein
MTHVFALLALFGICSPIFADENANPSERALAGCYLKGVQASDYSARGLVVKSHSYLEIKKDDAGALVFETVVIGANLNICGADGKLEEVSRARDKTVLRLVPTPEMPAEHAASDQRSCRLQIVATSRAFYLEDPDGACRELFFCGTGVGLDGEHFDRRRSKQTKGKRCPPY